MRKQRGTKLRQVQGEGKRAVTGVRVTRDLREAIFPVDQMLGLSGQVRHRLARVEEPGWHRICAAATRLRVGDWWPQVHDHDDAASLTGFDPVDPTGLVAGIAGQRA